MVFLAIDGMQRLVALGGILLMVVICALFCGSHAQPLEHAYNGYEAGLVSVSGSPGRRLIRALLIDFD